MEQDKKRMVLICDYETLLREAIIWYNSVYKTDFLFVEYLNDEVNFAVVEYIHATDAQLFDLGRIYGSKSEAFDKKLSNPTSSFM
jgi:hypothetical protein